VVVTVKERLQQVVSEMSEDEAADALALVAGARAGATPVDIYGTAWGQVLADADPQALAVTGRPTIAIPDGIPNVK
jgi:flagellar motility protein MotE (MotC chaperone)